MKKYVCTVCGYIAEGEIPAQCPVCKAPASAFVEKTGNTYVTEHVVGIGKAEGVPQEIVDGLRANFEGECSEVGMYLAMARVAEREATPRSPRPTSAMLTKRLTMHPALQSCWASRDRQHQEEPDDAC